MKTTIYYADTAVLDAEDVFQRYYQNLPLHRQAKVGKLKVQSAKRLSVGAGTLLCHALVQEGIDQNAKTAYGDSGKPYLLDYPHVHFNLSHSGTKVICAISEHQIGCDVERIVSDQDASRASHTDQMAIAKRFYTQQEYQLLLDTPSEQARKALFYQLWTCKESFIKATGEGLKRPLNSFNITIDSTNIRDNDCMEKMAIPICEITEGNYIYTLYNLSIWPNYKTSCCIQNVDSEESFQIVQYEFHQ